MNQDVLDYRRVKRAIQYLEEHRTDQPQLDDVAAHVGLSKHHFHRLFLRWAGTTPKRFLEHLTVEHARALLKESRPVLDAAYRSGLSGGGRLHDHFVRVEAVTPGEVKRGGAGLRIRTGVHPTPFGPALLAATDRGICYLSFLPDATATTREAPGFEERGGSDDQPGSGGVAGRAAETALSELGERWPEARIEEDPETTGELARRAFSVLDEGAGDGETGHFLHLHLRGTNFQLQVWRALLRIPPGRVTTYGTLAERVGRPGAARAVGGAVGANPVSFLIPCHRVIRTDGRIGGYRWGTLRKRAILAWEETRSGAGG